MLYLSFFFLFLSTTFLSEASLSKANSKKVVVGCLDENSHPVDYWVAIKHPQGTNYFYYDSTDHIFNISPYSMNDTTAGALTYTTKQLWLKDTSYVIYNDQPPKAQQVHANATKFGHSKGFFAFDSNSDNGFFMTHSIPLYPLGPKQTDTYRGLGSNAWTYAQNILCLSVTGTVLNAMAKLFLLNKPQIYDSILDVSSYTTIQQLIDGKSSTVKQCLSAPFTLIPFTLYTKTAEWNNDLYSECITPSQEDTLWVETWIRGSAIGPNCPPSTYNTLDIQYLSFVVDSNTYAWSETQDHSKWAITKNKDIICMSDINRMTTQYSRGGGSICFSDPLLHGILKRATTKTNVCG